LSRKIGILVVVVAGMATVIAAGCASVPLRTETSTSGIRAAEEVGAAKVPQAALHLQLAREELDRSEKLASRGDQERASSYLQRSEADSELAVALSREAVEKSKTRAARESVRQLSQTNK
jgi:hypothetical protein